MRRGGGIITQSWRKAMKAVRVCAVLALGALSMGGCTPDWAKGAGEVQLVINSINGGTPLQSDVEIKGSGTPPSGGVCADFVKVNLQNAFKNPGIETNQFVNDIVVQRYEVHYVRSDGRSVEGVDVPYSITGNVAAQVPAGGTLAGLNLEVVRIQAKLEAPLLALEGPAGGSLIVTMFADITLHAATTTGKVLNPVTGRLQIDFANFGDDLTACPVIT